MARELLSTSSFLKACAWYSAINHNLTWLILNRFSQESENKKITNLYVKNLSPDIDSDDKLQELFAPFGDIHSVKLCVNNRGKSKGYGFVAFTEPSMAERAVKELNGLRMISGEELEVIEVKKEEKYCLCGRM